MRLGIIGKPQAGKTSVFRILAERETSVAGGRQLGTAQVPDERVDMLARMFEPESVVRARVEYAEADAGRRAGAGGASAEVPEALRTADALVGVLGVFAVDDPGALSASTRAELGDLQS